MKVEIVFRFMLAVMAITLGAVPALAASGDLPIRTGPAPYTSKHVPHIQVGVEPVPEISKAFLRRVDDIPGVSIHDTIISIAGALGFWLDEEMPLTHPEVIVKGREFGHMHPDGSLHIALSPDLAARAIKAGWAIYHPWAKKRPGWEGFVMIYTPRTKAEMETVLQLVQGSYKFITGKDATD
ncbi:MAG: phospholipase [Alphaproteobacteria bacterium]|nr:phospholipase [Alphaproteobacteria bacterium]MBT4086545.1 phospholipase [Alphaproteobacteria bacterium]MBT4543105.1 phospholipase [Alphaproteobacteria bacterium]MBT7745339.1 phospholipase [Alphaproteobacteria bacterium]